MYDIPQNEQQQKRNTILIIAGFIFVLIMILAFTGYLKKVVAFINPDLENCKGGTCKGACTFGVETQNDGAKCSDTSKVCCVKFAGNPSAECAGRSKGDVCGTSMLCNEFHVCVSRCEYCAVNSNETACRIEGLVGRSVDKLDSSFTCGCSESECNIFDNSKLGTCVKNMCPSQNILASNYMCCSNPYKK